MAVKPIICEYNNPVEMEILEPIVAEWMEDDKFRTLCEFHKVVQMQIVDIVFDNIKDFYNVSLSDGFHFVNAKLDECMNNDFKTERIDVYDIVHIIRSKGHAAHGNLELKDLCTFTNNPQCQIGWPVFYQTSIARQKCSYVYETSVPGIRKI